MEIFINEDGSKSLVIAGLLNDEGIRENYLVKNTALIDDIYDVYYTQYPSDINMSILILENSTQIKLEIYYNEKKILLNTKILKNSVVFKMKRLKQSKQINELTINNRNKFNKLISKLANKSLEQHIKKLAEKIPTAMADAFSAARKRKK